MLLKSAVMPVNHTKMRYAKLQWYSVYECCEIW